MIHILFVHASDELYGADRILLEIVRGLDRSRFRATVALPDDVPYGGALSAELATAAIPVTRMKLAVLRRGYANPLGAARFLARWIASGILLATLIKRQRVDVVHSHTSAVFSGMFAAKLARRPHLWHVSEIIVRPPFLRRAIAWLLPRGADTVVTVSDAVRRHLATTEPRAQRARVIHNGIDSARFERALSDERRGALREELRIPRDAPIVGMIGRVGSWKGQELLLAAAPRIADADASAHFLFVGGAFSDRDAAFSRLRSMAAELGIDNRVTFVDFTDDVVDYLQLIDVFVQPSVLPDPFPTTVLEAMSAGKPIVATDHGGVGEMIVDGATGYLVPPGDAAAMAERIVVLLGNPVRAREMGDAGNARVRSEFSLQSFRAAYSAVYEELSASA